MGTPTREELARLEEAFRTAAAANAAAADVVRSLMAGGPDNEDPPTDRATAAKPRRRAARAPYVPQGGPVDEVTQQRVRRELQRRGLVSTVGKR